MNHFGLELIKNYERGSIEEILGSVVEETHDAIEFFSQWYQILGDGNLPEESRLSHVTYRGGC